MTHVVSVPSPLLGRAVWEPVAAELQRAGHAANVAAAVRPVRTPQDVVDSVRAVLPDAPAVLVPHSNARLSAPQVPGVVATVLVDAALPPADAQAVTMAAGPFADPGDPFAEALPVPPGWAERPSASLAFGDTGA